MSLPDISVNVIRKMKVKAKHTFLFNANCCNTVSDYTQ